MFHKPINTKSEFFNRVPSKQKLKIKELIQFYGHTDIDGLYSCLYECRIATSFCFSPEALADIIEHWRLDK